MTLIGDGFIGGGAIGDNGTPQLSAGRTSGGTLAYYQWGALGAMRNLPGQEWTTTVTRNLTVPRVIRRSLSGGANVTQPSFTAYASWGLSWDYLDEKQLGGIAAAYMTTRPFYFVDASHGNHLPAATRWEIAGGTDFLAPSPTESGPDGLSPAYVVLSGLIYRATTLIPVVSTEAVTFGATARQFVSGSNPLYVYADWFNRAGVQVGSSLCSIFPTSTASWTSGTATALPPSGAASARIALWSPNGVSIWVSQILARLDARSAVSTNLDLGWVPPGGSARVVMAQQPTMAASGVRRRSASIQLDEVT